MEDDKTKNTTKGTFYGGIGETTFYGIDVEDLRNFVAEKGWSLVKFQSISNHLLKVGAQFDPIDSIKDLLKKRL